MQPTVQKSKLRPDKLGLKTCYGERGAQAVEAALSILMVTTMIFSFMDLALNLKHQVSLQFAINEVVRKASIGTVTLNSNSFATHTPLTYAEVSSLVVSKAAAAGLTVNTGDVSLTRVCGAGEAGCTVDSLSSIPSKALFAISAKTATPYSFMGLVNVPVKASAVGLGE